MRVVVNDCSYQNFRENNEVEQDQIQDQFEVRFSLRAKILSVVTLLLIFVIAFVNYAGITLFTKDKTAYIYQAQSTEAALVATEVKNAVTPVFEALKSTLKQIDPNYLNSKKNLELLRSAVSSSKKLESLNLFFIDFTMGRITPVFSELKDTRVQEALEPELITSLSKSIQSQGYGFFNVSSIEKGPALGIVLVDQKLKTRDGLLAIAGTLSNPSLAAEVKSSVVIITDSLGHVLFDSRPEHLYQKSYFGEHPLFQAGNTSQFSRGALEFEVSGERYLGSFSKLENGLQILVQTPWQEAMKATYALTERMILLGGIAVGLAILFSIFFAKSLTAPVRNLYEATKEVAKGHFDLAISSKSSDEIGALSKSFSLMSKKISELIEESKESVRIENEVAIASAVQQTLIPDRNFSNERVTMSSYYEAASECGGDWWGFFSAGNKLAIFIADATGHGLPSALLTASARSCFSVMQKIAEENPDAFLSPADMLSYANRSIFDAAQGNIMMTFFGAVIDFDTKEMVYASAGHNPPWLFQKKNGTYQLKSLVAKGQRLGEGANLSQLEENRIRIQSDDLLFLYTDGIIEGTNSEGTQFGKRNVRTLMQKNASLRPEQIIDALMDAFKAHNGKKPFDDDVTLAVARFHLAHETENLES
jgi:sigma-B regulation protein RsbU (phosphoserine phosphatase)